MARRIELTEEKKMKLEDTIKDLNNLTELLQHILNDGMAQRKAAEELGVREQDFGRDLKDGFKKYIKKTCVKQFSEELMTDIYRASEDWHDRLLREILDIDVSVVEFPDYDTDVFDDVMCDRLTAREHLIICGRHRDNMTLSELGELWGLSANRIRQIEVKALRKLRHPRVIKRIFSNNSIWSEYYVIESYLNTEKLAEHLTPKTEGFYNGDREIKYLGLSTRSYNCLVRAGIRTFRDLEYAPVKDLMNVRCLGEKALAEIAIAMHRHRIPCHYSKEELEMIDLLIKKHGDKIRSAEASE